MLTKPDLFCCLQRHINSGTDKAHEKYCVFLNLMPCGKVVLFWNFNSQGEKFQL